MSELPFSKVLIANRGEIAVRIIQACRESGIASVAVYSTADRAALHVRLADEAFPVGPPPAVESYLNTPAILSVARESGAQAVHPGYGFLAENPEFARAVQQAGLVWIGPPPEVIALMGDKVAAKELASELGVPVIPGYDGSDRQTSRMLAEAERIGYPVMLKAAAGGGGKGMRVVPKADMMAGALESARREARSAFGDDRVFLEKLLPHPRHVEMQLMADMRGNVIYLGERDCTIQRRHQKVVEEAPSPVLTPELRASMGADAVRLARRSGYVNAGTVEFLLSGDSYYFLEMNTRIQVEHPVTEMVTGLDLVRMQLSIAAGEPLTLGQLDISGRGHAIEARIYAEDAERGFVPASGTLQRFRPPTGAGVRNDVGVSDGADISPHYDPMLAKLIVYGETRAAAVVRLIDALNRYEIVGITSNLPFLRWLAVQERFITGRLDTAFLEGWRPSGETDVPTDALLAGAAHQIVAVSPDGDSPDRRISSPWQRRNGWRGAGAPRTFIFAVGEREYRVQAAPAVDGSWTMAAEGVSIHAHIVSAQAGEVVFQVGPRTIRASVDAFPDALIVGLDGRTYRLQHPRATGWNMARTAVDASNEGVSAPMPGTVVKVEVREGQRVDAHQPLVVVEAMKMEHVIEAPSAGIIRAVHVREGDLVPAGTPVVALETE